MNIAVFGFYSRINEGDDRLMHAWVRLLYPHQCTFFLHYSPPPLYVLEHYDLILIGGGGLVWEHVGIWKNVQAWTKKLRIPVGVAGLGVNHVPEILVCELKALIDYSTFFYVRDQESKDLLAESSKVEVHTDLSWVIPHQVNKRPRENYIAWNHAKRSGIPAQAVLEYLKGENIAVLPFYLKKDEDLKSANPDSTDETTEFDLQTLSRSEFIVCCRYHAIQYAIQTLTPFIAIAYDDKILRLIKETGLEEFTLRPDGISRIPELISDIRNRREYFVRRLSEEREKLVEKGEVLSDNILKHVNEFDGRRNSSLRKRVRRRILDMVSQCPLIP